MEKELDFLEKIWGFVKEWQGSYLSWKDGSFVDIKVSPTACLHGAFMRLARTGRDYDMTIAKMHTWDQGDEL